MAGTATRLDALRVALDAYRPTTPLARIELQRFEEVLAASQAPFDRKGTAHVTVSAFVLNQGRLLMHRHKLSGLVLPPGGHIEFGESIEAAARREVLEETGVHCQVASPSHVCAVYVGPAPRCELHLDISLLAFASSEAVEPALGESPKVAWLRASEVEADGDIPKLVREAARAVLAPSSPVAVTDE